MASISLSASLMALLPLPRLALLRWLPTLLVSSKLRLTVKGCFTAALELPRSISMTSPSSVGIVFDTEGTVDAATDFSPMLSEMPGESSGGTVSGNWMAKRDPLPSSDLRRSWPSILLEERLANHVCRARTKTSASYEPKAQCNEPSGRLLR